MVKRVVWEEVGFGMVGFYKGFDGVCDFIWVVFKW